MSPIVFAWRSLTRQPARALLGIAGVAIVGALLFDMLLLSRGLSVSFRELLDAVGYDVRVTATKAFPGMGPAIADATDAVTQIGGLPGVREAVPVRLGGALGYDARDGEVRIDLIGVGGPVRDTWSVIDGRDLFEVEAHGPPPIVINRAVARRLDLEPGDTVRLRGLCREDTRALPLVAFRVAGVADFLFDVARSEKAATRLPDFDRACDLRDADEADFLLVGSETTAGAAEAVAQIRAARPDLHVFSNEQFVERLRISNFSYFRQVSFALSTITLFFAFLLIATLLTVSVNQRLGEVAGLRAIGFSRRRVVLDLVAESLALVVTGGLLSLPLGGLIAAWLDAILREMPGLPERLHFFVFQPRAVALHALLLIGTGVVASLYPLYIVARLPIAGTLRREVVSVSGPLVEAHGLTKVFPMPAGDVTALDDVTLQVARGEYTAVTGPSGCGKSTLLHLLGCVETATTGKLSFDGRDVSSLSDRERSRIRLTRIGFVFQRFFLLPMLTAAENVELPQSEARVPTNRRRERTRELLDYVGLSDRAGHRPSQLSGGEMQRVAIARALSNRPELLLADEPTGELDEATGEQIAELIDRVHADGTAIVVVTHNASLARRAARRLQMRSGRIEIPS